MNITGTSSPDLIPGTLSDGRVILPSDLGSDDTISGLDGDDTISGLGGKDLLYGGLDNDSLLGGAGNDSLLGGAGNDSLLGGAGADLIDGGDGNDILNGGVGDDFLDGGGGVDRIIGGTGFDVLFGGEDAETQIARDTLTGGADTDYFQLLYTGFIPGPPVPGEPIVSPPVGDYIVDFVKGTDFFLVPGITFEQLGFQNITLPVGGVPSLSTRIYVLPEVGIPITQAETLAVVQGVRTFNASHFLFEPI